MTVRNLSPSTQQSYVYAVANFSRHFGRSPDQLGLEEVRAYQLHLIGLKRSWAHINQVTCALRFFYAVTLGRKEAIERIISAREPGQATTGAKRGGGRPLPGGCTGPARPRCLGDGLRRRPAGGRG
jgi:hypothetical protein